jgi:uncharacterized protein YjiS (DUF1127 family)
MNIFSRLARAAGRVWRSPARKNADTHNQTSKSRARAQLSRRLSPHLLKDIGVDDG